MGQRWRHPARALPHPASEHHAPLGIDFTEPVIGFSLGLGGDRHSLVLRVHFGLEGTPPWLREQDKTFTVPRGYALDLRLTPDEVRRAGDQWSQELAALPAPTSSDS